MRNKFRQSILGVILFLCMQVCFATSFNATIESNQVNFGDSIKLKLLLTDAKPVEHIDISTLAKDFTIHNQQQFSSYRNVNGTVQIETGWHVILMPKNEGTVVIPPLALETDQGRFSTQPMKINVLPIKPGSKKSNDVGISLISIVSKAKAYVNEPIIYTLKIISYKNIANIVLDDIKSNDAIIEKIGEPKQYNQIYGGVNAHIIEIRYAVTALKSGKVTISPALLRGELQVPVVQSPRSQRFGLFNDAFLDNMIELKPFSLQSDKITMDIMEAPFKNTTTLPLLNLEISEKWDGIQNIKVGDTVTRKIKMTAKGAFAKQLPSVQASMQVENLKFYANKPNFDDKYSESENTIIGVREEEYSIVPQQEGDFTLPELKIKWWNVKTKKLEIATLPAKQIRVAAANSKTNPNVTIDYSNDGLTEQGQETTNSNVTIKSSNVLLYTLLGLLAGITLSFGTIILYLIKRKTRVKENLSKSKKVTTNCAKTITSAMGLRTHIMSYAVKHWGCSTNITLNRLSQSLTNNNYKYDVQKYVGLCDGINGALYAREANAELDGLIKLWDEFKRSVQKTKAPLPEPAQDYTEINPT